jgi:hypothetical protein
LANQLQREISQNQKGDGTNGVGASSRNAQQQANANNPAAGTNARAQAALGQQGQKGQQTQQGQQGQGQQQSDSNQQAGQGAGQQGNAEAQNSAKSPDSASQQAQASNQPNGGEAQPGKNPGEGGSPQPGSAPGQRGTAQSGIQPAQPGAQGGGAANGGDPTEPGGELAGGSRGQNLDFDRLLNESRRGLDAPLTGGDFGNWSDRLREVEELLDAPDLRDSVAKARERARAVRQDFKRDRKKPDWAVVQLQVMKPLTEVRDRIADELARRESREALVPLDRDPVPNRYSDLVRHYYEELGKDKQAPPQ